MPAKKQLSSEEALLSALQHPLRKQLLRRYVEAEKMLSPKELADITKKPVSNVGYHVRVLAEKEAVELVAEQPRRGSVEHFYAATSLVDAVPWGRLALGLFKPRRRRGRKPGAVHRTEVGSKSNKASTSKEDQHD